MKLVAIGGAPGTGKTTLMKRLMDRHGDNFFREDVPLVPFHYYPFVYQQQPLYVLGRYEEGGYAQGTDRMSMAVQPKAIEFLDKLDKRSLVLFEGDRLFNASFLENCVNKYDTLIIHLKTSAELREQRYADRGSNQDPTWLKGRLSKIDNILSNMVLMFNVEHFDHNTQADTEAVVQRITKFMES